MQTGANCVQVVRHLLTRELLGEQLEYEAKLEGLIASVASKYGIEDVKAVSFALRQIRTLPIADRERESAKIFTLQFPQLSFLGPIEITGVRDQLFDLERQAGRAHLSALRVRKSTIQSVMRPLDRRWVETHPYAADRVGQSELEETAESLRTVQINSLEDLDNWQTKVFGLFLRVVVFDPKAEEQLKGLPGLVRADQFRSYRRNWSGWFTENNARVLQLLSSGEALKRIEIDHAPRKSRDLMKDSSGFGQRAGYSIKKPNYLQISLGVRPQGFEELSAKRSWSSIQEMSVQLNEWLESVVHLWGLTQPKLMLTLEIDSNKSKSNLVYTAVSHIDAYEKTMRVLELSN
jgi:hypothetical protein